MDANIIVNLVVGLGGVIAGAIVAFISLRKMPSEIKGTESNTMRNILESNKLLSDDNRLLHKEIDELRAWFSGTMEIRNRIELTYPPRVVESSVRRMPAYVDKA